MNRTEKQAAVKGFTDKLQKAKAFILAEYKGLTVSQMTDLRRKLHGAKSSVSVIKNRLFKRALKELSISGLDDHLRGATAITSSDADPVATAKILVQFAKENEKFKIKAGFMESKILDLRTIEALSSLPSREVLLTKLLWTLNGPATNFANVLAAVPRKLVYALNAIKEKKQ